MKDVLQYLFGRLKDKQPVTHNVDGQEYAVKADGTLGDAVRELRPQWEAPALNVSTLSSLVAVHKARLDEFPADAVAFHITTHLQVELIALKADQYGRRHVWARATHQSDTPFKFGEYMVPEDFLLAFRASFFFNEEAVKVQQLCSTVGSGEAVLVADDGISQEVTVKSGTVTKASIPLPPDGIPLIPWRTFRDAHPIESRFLLRMKGVKDSLPKIALFEIDAKWKLDTVHSIKKYLEHELPGVQVIA